MYALSKETFFCVFDTSKFENNFYQIKKFQFNQFDFDTKQVFTGKALSLYQSQLFLKNMISSYITFCHLMYTCQ